MTRTRTILSITAALTLIAALTATPAFAANPPPLSPGHVAYPQGGTVDAGLGVDPLNQNAQLAESIPATLAPSWHQSPPLCPQSAGSQPSSIAVSGNYTVVVERQYQCVDLAGYSTSTGALLWRKKYHFANSVVTHNSVAFIQHDDPLEGAAVDAISVATGAVLWSAPAGPDLSTSPVAVGDGLIAINEQVLVEATGKYRFSLKHNENGGASLISGSRIFYNSNLDIEAFSATTGARLWTYTKPSTFSQDNGPLALHNGLLYAYNLYSMGNPRNTTPVIDQATGALVRFLPASFGPIAFDGNVGIFQSTAAFNSNAIITAVNLATGFVYWSHQVAQMGNTNGQTLPFASPVIENGLVWMLDGVDSGTPGQLVALDEVTGTTISSTTQACSAGIANLAIAQHRIFTSSDCGTLTYVGTTVAPPVAPTVGERLVDPGFEKGLDGWKIFTTGEALRVTTPVHSGAEAVQVTSTSSKTGVIGLTQNGVVADSVAGKIYTASCWVEPSAASQTVTIRLLQYNNSFSAHTTLTTITSAVLAPGLFTQVTVSGTATSTGMRVIPQIYSTTQTAATGSVSYDDCSVSNN